MRIVSFGLPAQFAAGALAAALVAFVANRTGALTGGGMVAAVVVGGSAAAAGWQWAALLIFFFVSSTALSHAGATAKHARSGGFVAKTGARDAAQVLANGGVFAIGALAFAVAPSPIGTAAAMGALAVATSDTWATEIGMLSRESPRSIVTRQRVPVGASGGVTIAGTAAAVAGAGAIALGTLLFGVAPAIAAAVAAGGVAGSIADSLLGATIQEQRRCAVCEALTERDVHTCGATTTHVRGWRWLNNDAVNTIATFAGAAVASTLHLAMDPA